MSKLTILITFLPLLILTPANAAIPYLTIQISGPTIVKSGNEIKIDINLINNADHPVEVATAFGSEGQAEFT